MHERQTNCFLKLFLTKDTCAKSKPDQLSGIHFGKFFVLSSSFQAAKHERATTDPWKHILPLLSILESPAFFSQLRHRFKGSPILFKNHKCKQTHFPTPTYSQKLTLLCSPFEEAAAAVLKECGAEANNLVGLRRTMFSNREIFRLVAGCAE